MSGGQLDITDHKRGELDLARANRALRMLSNSNQTLIHTTDEGELLRDVCRIAVEVGGYRMAWVGLVERDDRRVVRPVAHAGFDEGYLASAGATWGEGVDGRGPAAVAIATGEPCITRNIPSDPAFVSRREAAEQRGYLSAIALPLLAEGRAFGVFKIYALETDAFDAAEVAILTELAGDVAYGITALRTRAERDRAERHLRTLLEHFPDFVSRFDPQGRFVYVSPSIGRTTGAAPEALLGRTPLELGICVDHESDVALQESLARVVAEGRPEQHEVAFRTPAGPRLYEVRHIPEKDERGAVTSVLGIATDLSERKAAERQLYLLNYALDCASEGIYLMEGDSPRFQYVNRSAAEALGYSRAELMGGMGVIEIDPGWTPESWERHMPEIRARMRMTIETTHRSRDGRIIPVEVTGNYFIFEGRGYNMAFVRDMTERKRAEAALRESEEQLRQAQKMEAIGNLAGGIAHDFNNLLSVILGYSSLLTMQVTPSDPKHRALLEIEAAGKRAAELTQQLLAFSRKQILQPKVVNLNDILTGMERMLRRLIGENIELTVMAEPALGKTLVDPSQMEQIVMNLAVNGRDAMPRGGKLILETANVNLDEHYAAKHAGVVAGPHVMLAVTDTGIGMDKATQARMFEPFFTTKELGNGTGLGLATVFGIMQQSGGNVWVDSEPGKGTTIKLHFPRTDAVASDANEAAAPKSGPLFGDETILLVEDDERVRALTRTILERHGYDVLEAQSGGDALLICEGHPAPIHLLLTDVIMPRMSGPQLSERLYQLHPEMKVLFMSGYTDNSIVRHGVLDSGVAFLQKPITPETLTRKVREVLDTT